MPWINRGTVNARLGRIPAAVKAAVEKQLAKEVMQGLVPAIQRAAPVSHESAATPGKLRGSVHAYENTKRELSYLVLADAKDEKGNFIGPPVEFGHKAVDGTHVSASPFFFPTYRAWKKPARRRVTAAARKAFKSI